MIIVRRAVYEDKGMCLEQNEGEVYGNTGYGSCCLLLGSRVQSY